MPTTHEVGPPRPDRFVGIFYFLWHDDQHRRKTFENGPYDISKILKRDSAALRKPNSPLWGPRGAHHYWGEPLYGYYRSDDPWVLRRHAYLLSDAGVDVLVFDTTNALTYPRAYNKLCEVFESIRQRGGKTPQIAFMVNTKAGRTAERLYRDLYQKHRFQSLWFYWKGKPLLLCDPAKASPEVREFFMLRRTHWPFTMENTEEAWHWEATYPQPYGYTTDAKVPEQVSVSVAQNLRVSDGRVVNMSDGDARGRSFYEGRFDPLPGAVDRGNNFQEQWNHALELDPPFVLITGWNEWIAGRFERPGKPIVFVDQYDQEHSRDIEFAKNGHIDHYYYQMVANIRRYKGVPELPTAAGQEIDFDAGFEQWQDVRPDYEDHLGETIPRDHAGVGGTHYSNQSGRHDIVRSKVAQDDEAVGFYLQTAEKLPAEGRLQGLWLLIDVDQNVSTGWEGYDLIVGRDDDGSGELSLEQHVENWAWKQLGTAAYQRKTNQLQITLPRDVFAKHPDGAMYPDGKLRFDFKWVDNLQEPGNLQYFYLSGDVAPEGRFNYRYQQ